MPIFSVSLLRHRILPSLLPSHLPSSSLLRHVSSYIPPVTFAAMDGPTNPSVLRKPPPDKNLLKARDTVKEFDPLTRDLELESSQKLLPNQAIGFVSSAQANFMRVVVESPGGAPENPWVAGKDPRIGTELLCVVKAVLKKIRRRVLVGDKVLVGSVDWTDKRGMIENAFKRETELLDPPIANVDHLLVLFSVEQPKLEPYTLTRFLVEADSTGIPLTLVINKAELVDEETLSAWDTRLHSWGYRPLFCSVNQQDGLDALEDILKGQTTVIVGPSGVGKSSLINALRKSPLVSYDEEMDSMHGNNEGNQSFEDQRVGIVSKKSGRGKHTTRHVSLLPLSKDGFLADTPGFNQPHLLKVTKKSLAETFPEIRQMLRASKRACSFNDCLHIGEPGCVVKGDWERYPYYLQLLDEIKIREEFQLRTLGTKRESDVRYKTGDMGIKQAEPRLEPKKHRRVSRKRLNQSILDELEDEQETEDNDESVG